MDKLEFSVNPSCLHDLEEIFLKNNFRLKDYPSKTLNV